MRFRSSFRRYTYYIILKYNHNIIIVVASYVSPCKRDSDDLNQCIANVWEALRPKMGEGTFIVFH